MKQFLFYIVFGLSFFPGNAQNLDTIYANEDHNTALFFPSKVRQGIVGSQNFVFTYSEEKPQYFGLLKALPGASSNLLVLTQNGQIYSYVLSYKEELPFYNYFIKSGESIGNEVPEIEKVVIDSLNMERAEEDPSSDKRVWKKRAEYYLKNSTGKIKSLKRKGLKLSFNDMVYFREEVYLVVTIENKSEISFEPDYLNVYVSRGNRKKNSSYQRLVQRPIFSYLFPDTVLPSQEQRFVLVFPKFTLGENERLELEVRERKGSRALKLRTKL